MPYKERTEERRQELLNIATARGDRLAVAVLRPDRPYRPEPDDYRIGTGFGRSESERRIMDGNR